MSESKNNNALKPCGVIKGMGMAVPRTQISNEHFASYLETSDEWIRERTGIVTRYWAEEDESLDEFVFDASKQALKEAGLEAKDIDGIIIATSSGENVFPTAACTLQAKLGANSAFAYDLSAACSGFVYGLLAAQGHLSSKLAKNILVVGAEVFSHVLDKQDRSTCILFGDGVGACVLSSESQDDESGIITGSLKADGSLGEILYLKSGRGNYIKMQGREVFKNAVRSIADVSQEVLDKAGVPASELDWYISHQANQRILASVGNHLGLSEEKIPLNVSKYGNTSAASIPILLCETIKEGKIKKGDLVMLSAYGGGGYLGCAVNEVVIPF